MFCSRYLIVNLYDFLSLVSKSLTPFSIRHMYEIRCALQNCNSLGYDQIEQSTLVKNQYEITVYGIYRRVSRGHYVKQKAGVLVQSMEDRLKWFRIKKKLYYGIQLKSKLLC